MVGDKDDLQVSASEPLPFAYQVDELFKVAQMGSVADPNRGDGRYVGVKRADGRASGWRACYCRVTMIVLYSSVSQKPRIELGGRRSLIGWIRRGCRHDIPCSGCLSFRKVVRG